MIALVAAWAVAKGCAGRSRLAPPTEPITDVARSEAAAVSLERALLDGLVRRLADGDLAGARESLAADASGTFDDPGRASLAESSGLRLVRHAPGGPELDGGGLLERLASLAGGLDRYGRLEASADRFALDAEDPDAAFARVELRLAGWRTVTPELRVDARFVLRVRARSSGDAWLVEAFELESGSTLEGAPRFRDVARETGFTYAESAENRRLGQAFVDRHRTLALGGISVVDFEQDGFPDVLAVREGELGVRFRNDGRGGFVPDPLPMRGPAELPSFVLWVDLDGDGREELVSSRPTEYEGDRAYLGLYARASAEGELEHRPRAFALPNPVGLRRLAVQTIVPFDCEGDGDVDLFVAVYGSSASRGERYNTVDATDGADNYLLVNHGDLRFTEESDARGITGTRYTYVAVPFDFDRDGDVDVLEGNDFGPNVLWRNDGAGRFAADGELGFGGVPAYTMGATLADFDNSGRWSLYLSNMSSNEGARIAELAPDLGARMRATVAMIARGNTLYTETAGGAWTERAVELGVHEAQWAWGTTFFDADNDGAKDLAVTNGFTSHSDPALPDFESHYWRQVVADGRALERSEATRDVNAGGFASSFNGYERDRLFMNLGPDAGAMPDAAFVLGTDADHDGRAIAPLDVDGDGDLDLALWTLGGLVLLENTGEPRSWCRVALEARNGPHPPLGAVVSVRAGGVVRRDFVKLVDGFQTQVLAEMHFGLGDAERIDEIAVEWPSGARESWRDLAARKRIVLREGYPDAELADVPSWPEAARPRGGAPRPNTLLPRASGGFETPLAVDQRLVARLGAEPGEGWPELGALRAAHPDVRFVALVAGADEGVPAQETDSVRPDATLRATPAWLLEAFGPPPPGSGSRGTCVAVFDRRGGLVRIFRGDPPPGDLARALEAAEDEPAFPGLLVEHGRLALAEHRYREALARFQAALASDERDPYAWEGLGRAHVLLGRLDLAEAAYASAVEVDPDYALGHYNLGVTLAHLGRPGEAIAPLREAIRIEGPTRRNLLTLAESAAVANELAVAEESYAAAIAGSPDDASLHVSLGKVLARRGELERARESLQRALALDPTVSEGRPALAKVEELLAARQPPR